MPTCVPTRVPWCSTAAPPDNVMVVWFGDDARVSTVVGTAPEEPVFDLPTYVMRMVDPAGRLRPVLAGRRPSPTSRPRTGSACTRSRPTG